MSAITNYYKLGGFKHQEPSLAALDAKHLKGRCQQGHTPTEVPEEDLSWLLPASDCQQFLVLLLHHEGMFHGMELASPCAPASGLLHMQGRLVTREQSQMVPDQRTLRTTPVPLPRLQWPMFHSKLILLPTEAEPYYHYLMSV